MKKILLFISALFVSVSAYSQYWSTQNSAFATASRGIAGMEVFDANTVWAFAYDGVTTSNNVQEFTKTSNGGTTWSSGTIEIGDSNLGIANISGVSGTTAWVAAYDTTTGIGGAYKTSDGGASWVAQQALTTSGESWVDWVHFFDANNGLLMGDPEGGYFEIYKTSDGGATWTRVPSASIPAPLSSEYGYNAGYYAVGNNVFFYTNKGRIIKSTDKGNTWSIALTTGTITDFGSATVNGDMAWSDANNGIVFRKTWSGTTPTALTIHRTTNGGTSWSTVTYTGIAATDKISDVTYVPGTTTLVATASAGGSWKSLDNGTTWVAIDSGIQHLGVRCADINTCYSGGFNTSATVGGMFKSTTALAVDNASLLTKSSIFPNPSKGEFNLKTSKKVVSISVFDATGKLVLTTKATSFNLSSLPKGVYIMNASYTDGSKEERKLIKE